MKNHEPAMASDKIVQLPKLRRATLVPAVARPQAPIVVPFQHWVAVRDQAAAGLLAGGKRLLLTGPAGTGKTVLLEHLARVLRAAGRTVIVQLADADPQPPPLGTTLFVDEADRLAETKRRDLQASPGTLVLAGLAPLAPRRLPVGTVHLKLEPLDQDASRTFVAQWLQLNGRTPSDLESPAVRSLIQLSGGVPRLMSTLLASAVWLAETSGAPTVSAGHVQEAAELRSVLGAATPPPHVPEPVRRGSPLWSATLAAMVLAGTAAAVVPRLFPQTSKPALSWAENLVSQAEHWVRAEPAARQAAAPAGIEPNDRQAVSPADMLARAAPIEPSPGPDAARHHAARPDAPAPDAPGPDTPEPVLPGPVLPGPVVVVEQPVVETGPVGGVAFNSEPEPVPEADAAPPTVEAVAPPPPPEAARPVRARSPELPIETVAFLLRRGTAMMQLNDLSAARLLFRRAADSGNAEAMLELARTFDPAVLAAQGAAPMGEPTEASHWYRRAAENGNAEAEAILKRK